MSNNVTILSTLTSEYIMTNIGFQPKDIPIFPNRTISNNNGYKCDKPEECCVCCEKFNESDSNLSCGHYVHMSCILKSKKSTCPLCREYIILESPWQERNDMLIAMAPDVRVVTIKRVVNNNILVNVLNYIDRYNLIH